MGKKWVGLMIAVVVTGVIFVTLLSNKAKMAAESESFTLSSFPVTAVAVERRNVSADLTQIGVIAANNDVTVVSETQGRVTAVYVKVGSSVGAGSVIAKVDDELQYASYLAAQTNYEKAKKDLERLDVLHRQEIISVSQLEGARLAFKAAEAEYTAARRQYQNSAITSPIAGQISERLVEVGTMVTPGKSIANVVDISRLKVKLNLSEEDVFRVKVGDPVEIATDVYPGVKFYGRIETISAKGDEAHTYPVEIAFSNNQNNPLKAGMFGRVIFKTGVETSALVIPREALVGSVKDPQVFVVEDGKARLRSITVGAEIGTDLTVLRSLREGETVVVSGQSNLSDNVAVKVMK